MATVPVSTNLEPWHVLGNKVVMVTGASSGIGRQICLDLARAGCRILAASRRVDRLKSLCDEINSFRSGKDSDEKVVRAVAVELDVAADGPVIEESVRRAWGVLGCIDALVNNAGVRGTVQSPLELSEEEWDSTMKTNLRGSWLVSKYVCTRMRDAGRMGSVINISSISGLDRGQLPGGVAYAASKIGVNMLAKFLAIELGAYNIRANAIAPGLFRSEIMEKLMEKDWLDNVAKRIIPLKTHGTSDPALTSLVRYLIHDSSEYVSGNVFIVDAGATLPGVPIFSSL
ncbi:unnamed protein product [Rhodiola kirilowii]